MPFGAVVVEVPLLVGHMVVSKIVVVEVLFVLVVTHVVDATIFVGMQFFVPTILLVFLVSLQKILVVVGSVVDILHTCQVDFNYVVY